MRVVLVRLWWLMVGAGLAALLLEAVLRVLPVSMGLYRTQQYDRWPLQSYEPRRSYAYSFSWALRNAQRGVTNNYGHIAPFDFRMGAQPLVVLGDSFVEALMNDYQDTLQGQLGARLADHGAVYGLGVSGLSIADYLGMAQLAGREFKPTGAVVVLVDGDISESVFGGVGHYYFARGERGVAVRYRPLFGESALRDIRLAVGDVSLYRYLKVNLGFTPERFMRRFWSPTPAPSPRGNDAHPDLRPVVDHFLDELAGAMGVHPQCVVFLLDSDRYAIYNPKLASARIDPPELRRYFMQGAVARGYRAVELDPLFRRAYAEQRMKFDYWPIDRHWNARGHAIASDVAYQELFGSGRGECLPGGSGERR